MKKVGDLISDDERAAIRAPIESARTLPRRAFTDPDFYRFEVERVLAKSWFAVGFSPAIKGPGDLKVMCILGFPIFLVRGHDGIARAFHNVCPYDGCEVSLTDQSQLDQIVAPYHGWRYSLDGKLIEANYWDGTPMAESISVDGLNADLVPIACHEWMNTIFIQLDGDPESFERQYRAVFEHFRDIDFSRLEIGTDDSGNPLIQTLPINANWKTVYENYSPNVYHESFVHAMYRKSPHSPRVDADGNKTYTEINDSSGFLGLCYDNSIDASFYGETSLPKVLNRDGSPNRVNTIANAFPNWVTTMLSYTARISIFLPESHETGTQIVATLFDRDGAIDSELAGEREQAAKKGIIARVEDNRICESIQRARHSPAVDSQFYSPFWDAMHYTLNNLILDRLEQGDREID